MIRYFSALLVVGLLITAASASDSTNLNRMRSWTHVNGNSAMLELLDFKMNWVKFRKPNGELWTMPIQHLAESDRAEIKRVFELNDAYTLLTVQDTNLDSVRQSFAAIKTDNPTLYSQLNELAEYPIEDYEIQVNDEGQYYLQFMLKEGASPDNQIEAAVARELNARNSGDPIAFRLAQIPQDAGQSEIPTINTESEITRPSPNNGPTTVDHMDMTLTPGEPPQPIAMNSEATSSCCGTTTYSPCCDVVYYAPCATNSSCCSNAPCCTTQHHCCDYGYEADCCSWHNRCRRPIFFRRGLWRCWRGPFRIFR